MRKSDRVSAAPLLAGAIALLALSACGEKKTETATTETTTTTTTANEAAPAAEATPTPAAAEKPAADSTDTLGGQKFADFTGDAASGEKVFVQCKTCHVIEAGQNRIGPSLNAVVGRKAGTIAGFSYTVANRDSGITWTEAKLFQYLENPQRVVPGTKMTFTGVKDPQKRADVIAYLKANS